MFLLRIRNSVLWRDQYLLPAEVYGCSSTSILNSPPFLASPGPLLTTLNYGSGSAGVTEVKSKQPKQNEVTLCIPWSGEDSMFAVRNLLQNLAGFWMTRVYIYAHVCFDMLWYKPSINLLDLERPRELIWFGLKKRKNNRLTGIVTALFPLLKGSLQTRWSQVPWSWAPQVEEARDIIRKTVNDSEENFPRAGCQSRHIHTEKTTSSVLGDFLYWTVPDPQ